MYFPFPAHSFAAATRTGRPKCCRQPCSTVTICPGVTGCSLVHHLVGVALVTAAVRGTSGGGALMYPGPASWTGAGVLGAAKIPHHAGSIHPHRGPLRVRRPEPPRRAQINCTKAAFRHPLSNNIRPPSFVQSQSFRSYLYLPALIGLIMHVPSSTRLSSSRRVHQARAMVHQALPVSHHLQVARDPFFGAKHSPCVLWHSKIPWMYMLDGATQPLPPFPLPPFPPPFRPSLPSVHTHSNTCTPASNFTAAQGQGWGGGGSAGGCRLRTD